MNDTSLYLAVALGYLMAAPAAASAQADPNPTVKPATLAGELITLPDGRHLKLRAVKLMMPYPELELLAPVGARVEVFKGATKIHTDEVPFLWKKAEVNEYVKIVVHEAGGSWSLKFLPATGFKTIIEPAEGAAPKPAAPPAPAPAAVGNCRKTLIAKGHHAMHLDNCDGVDNACAVKLLEMGHHPQALSNCEVGLAPRCVQTLLAKKHAPMHLSNCRDVDDACAVALLERGDHPMHLSNCAK